GQRRARRRHRRGGELRPARALGGGPGARDRLRRGGLRQRRPPAGGAVAPRAAQLAAPGGRARRPPVRGRDPCAVDAGLPRLRRHPARPGVGDAHRPGPRPARGRLVGHHPARARHRRRRAGRQPAQQVAGEGAMTLLDIQDLQVAYRTRRGEEHTAVAGVSLTVEPGEVVAIVGETGSGKTTAAHAVLGLLAPNATVRSGRVLLQGTDISGWSRKRMEAVRGRVVGLVPQDPGTSLDPLRTVGWQVAETLRVHGERDRRVLRDRVVELLERVGLPDPRVADAYPHELSGGMRQRVLIAAALALRPALLIADEPTSALDVTVQRRILDLLDELREEDGSGVLFVTHDLAAAAERADRIVVMRDGRVVDAGPVRRVVTAPAGDYTHRLVRNAPALNPAPFRPAPPAAAADQASAIEVRGLVKEFTRRSGQSVRAVEDVSFTVPAGTTHAIVGESGSGKSTTARILLGFE